MDHVIITLYIPVLCFRCHPLVNVNQSTEKQNFATNCTCDLVASKTENEIIKLSPPPENKLCYVLEHGRQRGANLQTEGYLRNPSLWLPSGITPGKGFITLHVFVIECRRHQHITKKRRNLISSANHCIFVKWLGAQGAFLVFQPTQNAEVSPGFSS